jgi:hypothetical protein
VWARKKKLLPGIEPGWARMYAGIERRRYGNAPVIGRRIGAVSRRSRILGPRELHPNDFKRYPELRSITEALKKATEEKIGQLVARQTNRKKSRQNRTRIVDQSQLPQSHTKHIYLGNFMALKKTAQVPGAEKPTEMYMGLFYAPDPLKWNTGTFWIETDRRMVTHLGKAGPDRREAAFKEHFVMPTADEKP